MIIFALIINHHKAMAIYLNPGNEGFRETLANDIYIDKTMLISELNKFIDKGNKYVCISRPRRFGKTIATNMMGAYYSKGCDSRELFKDLKISKADNYEKYLNKLNFISIDIASEYQNSLEKDQMLNNLTERVRKEFRAQFPKLKFSSKSSIADCIQNVYAATGERFVIILDEYDCLVRDEFGSDLFADYLKFLNGLFKSNTLRPAIALAYITGILPVVRDRVQSKLNNFEEYTILDARNLAEFVGFTKEEVIPLCEKYGMDYKQCQNEYNGYHQNGYEIFNPESVVKSMLYGELGSYWGKTSTFRVITDRLEHNYQGMKDDVVKMLAGENVEVNVDRYMNTMTDFITKDDVFTYLIHLGYLAYDKKTKTCRIPNFEVRKEWYYAVESMPDYSATDQIIKASRDAWNALLQKDHKAVAKALDESHIHVTSHRNFENEAALASAIYIAFVYALNNYTVIKEASAGKGIADVLYIPINSDDEHPAVIVELKYERSTSKALEQIKNKEYFRPFDDYKGKILLVAINYKKNKTHSCRITEWVKE